MDCFYCVETLFFDGPCFKTINFRILIYLKKKMRKSFFILHKLNDPGKTMHELGKIFQILLHSKILYDALRVLNGYILQ